MSYGELARITATPLDRAVDKAIADVNAAAIAEMEAEQAACPHTSTHVMGDRVEYSVEVCDDCGYRNYDTDEIRFSHVHARNAILEAAFGSLNDRPNMLLQLDNGVTLYPRDHTQGLGAASFDVIAVRKGEQIGSFRVTVES